MEDAIRSEATKLAEKLRTVGIERTPDELVKLAKENCWSIPASYLMCCRTRPDIFAALIEELTTDDP